MDMVGANENVSNTVVIETSQGAQAVSRYEVKIAFFVCDLHDIKENYFKSLAPPTS
jgi:hypothetical protein